ncbi:MAG: hypothetical protein ACOYMN_05945 [Roseimicrobium sp.]
MLKALDKWFLPWLRQRLTKANERVTDVVITICDHFEPFHHTDKAGALRRMSAWHEHLPPLCDRFRDAGGHTPRHTFFYPIEQYDTDVISSLADLCRKTRNEVEIHLHHHNDTAEGLQRQLDAGKLQLRDHGLLGSTADGSIVFGFIHGNWALDDSGPNGQHCGVRGELGILKKSGCYSDFTMPAAPNAAQTRIINSIYYAKSTQSAKSHDHGIPLGTAESPCELRQATDHLLLVQGPLALDWQRPKWGFLPRVENADLIDNNAPTLARLQSWIRARVIVQGQGAVRFVKLHTHGGPERNHPVLIGDGMRDFHLALQSWARESATRVHYASAREMVNMIHALEDETSGNPNDWRDYIYAAPPVLARG